MGSNNPGTMHLPTAFVPKNIAMSPALLIANFLIAFFSLVSPPLSGLYRLKMHYFQNLLRDGKMIKYVLYFIWNNINYGNYSEPP